MKLTEKQKKFADEYLIDLNATAAYGRAGYTAKGNAAEASASRLLSNAKVQEYIQQRMKDREKRTEITQDWVLQRWRDIAEADPNEIIHLRRVCCRHCFGVNHGRQWADEDEYNRAVLAEIQQAVIDDRLPNEISDTGGYGFDPTIRPHPKCPKCYGEGYEQIHAADTRDLSPKAKVLYAGVKQTQAGIEIKLHDQLKALDNIAKHLGMFVNEIKHSGHISTEVEIVITGDDDDEA